jgi:hypothetical protein
LSYSTNTEPSDFLFRSMNHDDGLCGKHFTDNNGVMVAVKHGSWRLTDTFMWGECKFWFRCKKKSI